MTEGHGLRPLQMRITGHDVVRVRLGNIRERPDHGAQQGTDFADLTAQIEPDIQRDLIVAAARGVQTLARVPDPRGQDLFHEHVDVLRFGIDRERAGFEIGENAVQPCDDLLALLCVDDALLPEHGGVRDGARDILAEHAGIKGDRGIEVVDAGVFLFGKARVPHFCHKRLSINGNQAE